jgi:hypothetical protein
LTGGAMLIAAKRPIIDTLALAVKSRLVGDTPIG